MKWRPFESLVLLIQLFWFWDSCCLPFQTLSIVWSYWCIKYWKLKLTIDDNGCIEIHWFFWLWNKKKNIQATVVYCHWSHHSGLSGCEKKRNPAGKEVGPIHGSSHECNCKKILQISYEALEWWQFFGDVRSMTIMIVISLISFPWPLTVRPGSPPFYLGPWIYCWPLFYRPVFIETRIFLDASKNVKSIKLVTDYLRL